MSLLSKIRFLSVFVAVAVLAGCTYSGSHSPKSSEQSPKDPSEWTSVNSAVDISVTEDESFEFADSRRFQFGFTGENSDSKGDLDFSQLKRRKVLIKFKIGPDAPADFKFKPDGRDAMWIERKDELIKALLEENNGELPEEISPRGPYPVGGTQFTNFKVSKDGKRLSVLVANTGQTTFRYNLRFDYKGETVQFDPDIGTNGESHQ